MFPFQVIAEHRIRSAHEPEVHFGPVGRCIYCDARGVKLSKEHIIPDGLGGNLVLMKASCIPCAEITGTIEQQVLQMMMGRGRAALDIRSKKSILAKREAIDHVFIKFGCGKPNSGEYRERVIPISDDPPFFIPMFTTDIFPSVLNIFPSVIPRFDPFDVWDGSIGPIAKAAQMAEKAGEPFDDHNSVMVEVKVNYGLMAQMFAKIGHAYAVAVLGIDNFFPMATSYITLKKPPHVDLRYMGAGLIPENWFILHDIRLLYMRSENPFDTKTYVVCNFRLFFRFNQPVSNDSDRDI
jgi:hypothetical protein